MKFIISFAVVFLLAEVAYSHSLLSGKSCAETCENCSENDMPVCEIGARARNYPCLCMLEVAVCRMKKDSVLLHEGRCLKRYQYYDFVNIKDLHFYSLTKNLPLSSSPTLRRTMDRSQKTLKANEMQNLSKKEICELFKKNNSNFRKMYEDRHFECSSVDRKKSAAVVDPVK